MRSEVGYNCRELTFDDLNLLSNESEIVFAFACLEVGCRVIAQIPTNGSVIDFFVINPNRPDGGKLVEVTTLPQAYVEDPETTEAVKKRNPKLGLQIASKHHQIQNMEASGQKWTILYGENISKIKDVFGDPRKK